MSENQTPLTRSALSRINMLWDRGLLMAQIEAAEFAGVSRQRISAAVRDGVLASVRVAGWDVFEATTLAAKWPEGPGAKAFTDGAAVYSVWVNNNLGRNSES